jgi:hypothetical protein
MFDPSGATFGLSSYINFRPTDATDDRQFYAHTV